MTHHPVTSASRAARAAPAETWTTELAHEIELYLTFWDLAHHALPDETEESESR